MTTESKPMSEAERIYLYKDLSHGSIHFSTELKSSEHIELINELVEYSALNDLQKQVDSLTAELNRLKNNSSRVVYEASHDRDAAFKYADKFQEEIELLKSNTEKDFKDIQDLKQQIAYYEKALISVKQYKESYLSQEHEIRHILAVEMPHEIDEALAKYRSETK